METMEEMKSFVTETPLNSACIAPARPYVRLTCIVGTAD